MSIPPDHPYRKLPDRPLTIQQFNGESLKDLYERVQIVQRQYYPGADIGNVIFIQPTGQQARMPIDEFVKVMGILVTFAAELRNG